MKNRIILCILLLFAISLNAQSKISADSAKASIQLSFKLIDPLFIDQNIIHVSGIDEFDNFFIQGIEKVDSTKYIIFQNSQKRYGYFDCISIEIQSEKVVIEEYYAFINQIGAEAQLVPDFISGKISYPIETFNDLNEIDSFFSYFAKIVDNLKNNKFPGANAVAMKRI